MIGPWYHLGPHPCPVTESPRCPGHYRDEPTLRDLTFAHAEWLHDLKGRKKRAKIERRYQPRYDYIYLHGRMEAQRYYKAFGNAHVGDVGLTNMEIAYTLPSDNDFVVPFARVHAQFDDEKREGDLLRGIARNLRFTWQYEDRDRFQGHIVPNALIQISTVVEPRRQFAVGCYLMNDFEKTLNELECEGHIRVEVHGIEVRDVL